MTGMDRGLEEGVSLSRYTVWGPVPVRAGRESREGSSNSQLEALDARLGVCLILKVLGTLESG